MKLALLLNIFKSKDSLNKNPQDTEPLNRIIFSSRHIRSSDNTIRSDAFLPHHTRLDLSVYRVLGLSSKKIWQLVREFVEDKRIDGKLATARAELLVSDVKKHRQLTLNADGKPNFRHLNIENFPSSKSESKMIALELAAAARCFTKPR